MLAIECPQGSLADSALLTIPGRRRKKVKNPTTFSLLLDNIPKNVLSVHQQKLTLLTTSSLNFELSLYSEKVFSGGFQ